MSDHCRSCNKPVRWIKTTLGNTTCIDPEPVEGGNIVIESVEGKEVARTLKRSLFDQENPPGPRYQSHFASCPNADRHRKRK